MVIQWYGQSCFKIQSGELVLAVDPFDKSIGLTPPRFRADVALSTHEHADHANVGGLAGDPFVIAGPGEYEIKGITVYGIPSFHDAASGKTRGANTIYKIEMEDIKLVHLGDFGEEALRPETADAIGEVDILFVPVGGNFTIGGVAAAKIAKELEPRFVIPMHYKIPGLGVKLETAEQFLKELGASRAATEDRLTIKRKDIGEKEKMETFILASVTN